MRALILNGSARPIGSTGNIVGDIIEELEKGGVACVPTSPMGPTRFSM